MDLISCIPPIMVRALRGRHWRRCASWEKARQETSGYNSPVILEKVKHAVLKVMRGEAAAERDSVLFDSIVYSWPLAAGLMCAAARRKGRTDIIDYGGSLGSSYFQNKKFLDAIGEYSWRIVEQKSYVDIGRAEIHSSRLSFHYTLEDACKKASKMTLLLSSVLQYIDDPFGFIRSLGKYGFQMIIIDRAPVSQRRDDMICIQHVPASIYRASYPCRIMSEKKLVSAVEAQGYRLLESFDAIDGETLSFQYRGFIFIRKMDQ